MFIPYQSEIRTLLRTLNSKEMLTWVAGRVTAFELEDNIYYGQSEYCEDLIELLLEARPYGYKISVGILEDIMNRA